MQTLAHLEPEALELALRRNDIGAQLRGTHHHMPSFTNGEVAEERNYISSNVNDKNPSQPDVVIDEAHQRTGNQPSALYASHHPSWHDRDEADMKPQRDRSVVHSVWT